MTVKLRAFHRLLLAVLVCAIWIPSVAMAELPEFRDIALQNSPAVVKIIVEQDLGRAEDGYSGPEEIPEYLRRFFEYRGGPPVSASAQGHGVRLHYLQRRLHRDEQSRG